MLMMGDWFSCTMPTLPLFLLQPGAQDVSLFFVSLSSFVRMIFLQVSLFFIIIQSLGTCFCLLSHHSLKFFFFFSFLCFFFLFFFSFFCTPSPSCSSSSFSFLPLLLLLFFNLFFCFFLFFFFFVGTQKSAFIT